MSSHEFMSILGVLALGIVFIIHGVYDMRDIRRARKHLEADKESMEAAIEHFKNPTN